MRNKIKFPTTQLILFFCTIVFISCNNNPFGDKIDISQSKEEIKNQLLGKWSSNQSLNSFLVRYRYEISNDKIKIWRKGSILENGEINSDWKIEPDEVVNYTIREITEDENGSKQIVIAEGESFGKLIIDVFDNQKGVFKQLNGEENSMFKDWKH